MGPPDEEMTDDPFDCGTFKAHLLMHGFMHGHTRWISEDDDDEDVDGAGITTWGHQTKR